MLREARRVQEGKGELAEQSVLPSGQIFVAILYSIYIYSKCLSIVLAESRQRKGETEEGLVSSLCCGHMFCIIIVVKCLDSVFYFVFSFVSRADKMLFYQLAVYEVAFLFAF